MIPVCKEFMHTLLQPPVGIMHTMRPRIASSSVLNDVLAWFIVLLIAVGPY
jgi:hypothetical protein